MSLTDRLWTEANYICRLNGVYDSKLVREAHQGLKDAYYSLPKSEREKIKKEWDDIGY